MKILKGAIVSVLALFFLSACTQFQQTTTLTTASPVLDRILKRGELVIGTMGNMPPLNMTTKDGQTIGFEVDLAQLMANAMGVKYRFEKMAFSELLPALQSGKVDMILSGMTITPDRNLKVAFVGPYFISGKAFLTKLKTIADVKDAAEINSPDTKLVALRGSTSQTFVQKFIDKATLWTVDNYDEGINMVLQDQVDAMVADYPICLVSVFRYPEAGLISLITPLTYEPIGVAVPADDPLLVNWLENFLDSLDGSGTLDELNDRWFAEGAWLKRLPR